MLGVLFSKLKNSQGFTMVELLITIVLLMVIAGISLPSLGTYYVNNLLKETVDEIQDRMRTAQNRTLYGDRGNVYGVHFQKDSFTLFEGEAFELGHPENITAVLGPRLEIFDIRFNEDQDIVFSKGEGNPEKRGSLKLRRMGDSRYWEILVNEEGMIDAVFK